MDTPNALPSPVAPVDPGASSATGLWLGTQPSFGPPGGRKLGRAAIVSLVFHAILLFLVLSYFAAKTQVASNIQDEVIKMVFLPQAGPGGGGGGSPAPAPKKVAAIPPHQAPVPVPVPTPAVVPPPMLNAPVVTSNVAPLQSAGLSSVSLAAYGGGGSGGGIGSGTGNGVGPGTGGGFGGGAYHPGNGITNPVALREGKPEYTSDAMRAKIQGEVWVEAVVKADGTVGDVHIIRSLDKQYGLDQKALEAAKRWLFRPAVNRDGKPVDVIVTLQIGFTIH